MSWEISSKKQKCISLRERNILPKNTDLAMKKYVSLPLELAGEVAVVVRLWVFPVD